MEDCVVHRCCGDSYFIDVLHQQSRQEVCSSGAEADGYVGRGCPDTC